MAKEISLKKVNPKSFNDMVGEPDNKKQLPSISIDFSTLPAAADWPVGSSYDIRIIGEVIGKHDRKGKGSVEVTMQKIGGELIQKKRFSRR